MEKHDYFAGLPGQPNDLIPYDCNVVGQICFAVLSLVASWEQWAEDVETFVSETLYEIAVVLGYMPTSMYQYDCGLQMNGHGATISYQVTTLELGDLVVRL